MAQLPGRIILKNVIYFLLYYQKHRVVLYTSRIINKIKKSVLFHIGWFATQRILFILPSHHANIFFFYAKRHISVNTHIWENALHFLSLTFFYRPVNSRINKKYAPRLCSILYYWRRNHRLIWPCLDRPITKIISNVQINFF